MKGRCCSLSYSTRRKAPSLLGVPNNVATQDIHFLSSGRRTRFQFHLSGKKQEALLTDIYLLGWVPRGKLLSLEEPGGEGWRLALDLTFSAV